MEITVGIDVSKARLDVHLHPLGEHFVVDNDEAGVAGLCVRLLGLKGVQTVGSRRRGATSVWRWRRWPRPGCRSWC